jgi:5-formyltetrahydrofolate cyclo-ligase
LLAVRDAMAPGERALASAAICDAANAALETRLSPGQAVALYAAKGSEVETTSLDRALRERGWLIAYPRVSWETDRLAFHAVDLAALVPARAGLREPRADAPVVETEAIAAFVVPGLAFDRAGGRIGWGRGHYDRAFAAASPAALRIGLAYERQVLDEVAREAHDVALHIIITEVATYLVA